MKQIAQILDGTDELDMINKHVSHGVRAVLLVAAMAFEDDGSTVEFDAHQLQAIQRGTWPFVKEQVAMGIKSLPDPATRREWAQAVAAVYRIAEVDDIPANIGGLL